MKKNLYDDVLNLRDLSQLKGGESEDEISPILPNPPKKCNFVVPPTIKEANILGVITNTTATATTTTTTPGSTN